jgi:hypothetical protein
MRDRAALRIAFERVRSYSNASGIEEKTGRSFEEHTTPVETPSRSPEKNFAINGRSVFWLLDRPALDTFPIRNAVAFNAVAL